MDLLPPKEPKSLINDPTISNLVVMLGLTHLLSQSKQDTRPLQILFTLTFILFFVVAVVFIYAALTDY